MLVIIWTVAIVTALTLFFRQKYSRFSRYGVKYTSPVSSLANLGRVLLKLDHIADNIERTYNAFPEERFVGVFELIVPTVIIRDIELLKKITVKDFEHFLDHRSMINIKNEPLLGRNLFLLQGQEWKDMRSTLSPAFTSSKIRMMLPFMVEVGDQMMATLKNKMEESGVDFIDVESKDLTTRYANDVIATCAFGLKVNSHVDEDNEFYQMGKALCYIPSAYQNEQAQPSTSNVTIITEQSERSEVLEKKIPIGKFLWTFLDLPMVSFEMQKLQITLFPQSITSFFRRLVTETMHNREIMNIIRPDMIHLLMEAKKGKLSHEDKTARDADAGFATVEESSVGKKEINRVWSDEDLIAQAIFFFLAGFETVASVMSFTLHELALNPDVQEKLVAEIKENKIKNGGKFDYKCIQEMTYMDMIISEVLRLWPPSATGVDRQCTKDYNLGKPNDNAPKDYIIRKGEGIGIPVWAFHRDPKFFPDPLKFDPERFSEDNKHNIKPFTYMPFGVGPRNCIGSRFALCEVKVMIYQLLQHTVISPCEKTCIPTQLAKDSFNLKLKGGHWVRFKIRN